jgi:SAM-dependent methyltransferase
MAQTEPPAARVASLFDAWAREGRAEGMERGHAELARAAFGALALQPGERFLDVGCGNGYALEAAAACIGPRGRVEGIDVAPAMVERARARLPAEVPGAVHLGAFPGGLPADAVYDAVLSIEALYYLEDVDAGLAALRARLAPGGRFVSVIDHYAENAASHGWSEDLGLPMVLRSEQAWREAFAAAGFEAIVQRRILHPRMPGEAPGWQQEVGSLLTLGRRRAAAR